MFDQYKALIFDMDGTLVDSGRLHEAAWSETLTFYELPIDRQYMRSLVGVPTIDTLAKIIQYFNCTVSVPLEEMTLHKEAFVKKHMEVFVKPTALVDIVQKYYGRIPMSVGTGASTAEAESVLKSCSLHHFMDHIVGFDRVIKPKPAPDTFLLCAELMSVAPLDCVVFEDGKPGMEAARQAGMDVVDVLDAFSIRNDYFL